MKITSKKTDDLNQVLTVKVDAADYEAARKKKLNDMQRKADVPGFRKGHVPMSMVEKWYGQTALAEVVNTAVGDALQDYVNNKKLNIIGEPLPCEDQDSQEWKAGNDFTFKFDIAINPEVKLELTKEDVVPFYNINVTEAEKKKLVDAYKKQQPEAAEEDLAKHVAEQLSNEYKSAAEFRFEKDVRDLCVSKAALKVPEAFLRRWLIAANEGKYTVEQIDKDFEGFLSDYRWQLVLAYLTKEYAIKIEEADLTQEAKNFAKYQYAMYGIANVPEDALDNFVKSMLQDQSNVQRLVENVQNRKVVEAVREKVTVKPKKISAEKFREL